MIRPFVASFWELAAVYAAGAYAMHNGLCVYGFVQHSLPVLLVGAGLTLYWAARSFECIAAAITLKWKRST